MVSLAQQLERVLRPLALRVRTLLSMATVVGVDDSKGVQELQVAGLGGEARDRIRSLQPYGFTSVPHPGTEVGLGWVSGYRDGGFAFGFGDREYRLTGLEGGEVALYDDQGSKVHLKRDGEIEVEAEVMVTMKAPLLRVEGNIVATGQIIDLANLGGGSMQQMRESYNEHTHNENNNLGGPTNLPNQPMTGGGVGVLTGGGGAGESLALDGGELGGPSPGFVLDGGTL